MEAVSPQWHPVTGQEPMATKSNTERVHLNMMKHFFAVRVTMHCHKLPREVLESPSSEILKSHPDMVLGNHSRQSSFTKGVREDEAPFKFNHSVIPQRYSTAH